MQGNSLCNRLEFSYSLQANSKTFPFTATLTYTDATRILPTEVTVVCKGKRDQQADADSQTKSGPRFAPEGLILQPPVCHEASL